MGKTDEVIWDIINGQSYKKYQNRSFFDVLLIFINMCIITYIVPDAKGLQNVLYSTKHRIYQNSKSKERSEDFLIVYKVKHVT